MSPCTCSLVSGFIPLVSAACTLLVSFFLLYTVQQKTWLFVTLCISSWHITYPLGLGSASLRHPPFVSRDAYLFTIEWGPVLISTLPLWFPVYCSHVGF